MDTCFLVTPIGAAGSDARKRADNLLHHVLRPILKSAYEIIRADEIDEPGTITSDIIVRLYKSDLVIADLTGHNPNVMYEVGLRHCFSLPMVTLSQEGDPLPFDVAGERAIIFDINDIGSVEAAKDRIQKACLAARKSKPFRSVVMRALEAESFALSMPNLEEIRSISEKLDAIETSLSLLSVSVDGVADNVLEIDPGSGYGIDVTTVSRIRELVSLFDQVSPGDIRLLADAVKERR